MPIADLAIEAGASEDVDVSTDFSDPDADAVAFEAESDSDGKATVDVSAGRNFTDHRCSGWHGHNNGRPPPRWSIRRER